jgi:hypothetical protein
VSCKLSQRDRIAGLDSDCIGTMHRWIAVCSFSSMQSCCIFTVAFLEWKIKAAGSYGQGINKTLIEEVLNKV